MRWEQERRDWRSVGTEYRLGPMRSLVAPAVALIVAFSAPPAAPFEGTVTFTTDRGTTLYYAIRGGMARMTVSGEGVVAMIIDPKRRLVTFVLHTGRKYIERPMPDTTARDSVTLTDTGKGEVVAGVQCETWHVSAPKTAYDVCAASGMGGFFPPMRSSTDAQPAWAQQMRNDFFPLKVTDGAGKVLLLATKIERKTLDPSLFVVPAGYTKMEM